MKTRKALITDIDGVINLQASNIKANIPENEHENGFVTTPFTVKQTEEVIALDGLFIAEENNKVIAYIFGGNWEYYGQWEIFNYMTSRFPNLNFKDGEITTKNSFQYGPICIDSVFRGQNVLKLIFEEMRLGMVDRFPLAVTFINQTNKRSLRAHIEKLKWGIIDEFEFEGNKFYGLAYDMSEPVL